MSKLAEQITDLELAFEYCLWGMKEVMVNDGFEEMINWARPVLKNFYDLDLDDVIDKAGMTFEEFETECRKRFLKNMIEEWKLEKRRGKRG